MSFKIKNNKLYVELPIKQSLFHYQTFTTLLVTYTLSQNLIVQFQLCFYIIFLIRKTLIECCSAIQYLALKMWFTSKIFIHYGICGKPLYIWCGRMCNNNKVTIGQYMHQIVDVITCYMEQSRHEFWFNKK